MVYRIRYREAFTQSEGETVVEANSPNEAVVKFQHVHVGCACDNRSNPRVTSVLPEMREPEDGW